MVDMAVMEDTDTTTKRNIPNESDFLLNINIRVN
jgi:hypothetical protein